MAENVRPNQFFETTIADEDSQLAATIVVAPFGRREGGALYNYQQPLESLGNLLGSEYVQSTFLLSSPSQLPNVLAALLRRPAELASSDSLGQPQIASQQSWAQAEEGFGSEALAFADYVVFANVVPFESSPMALESLASIAAGGSIIGAGAAIGFALVAGSPLIFLAVPAGIILIGATSGVALGIQERIRRAIGGSAPAH